MNKISRLLFVLGGLVILVTGLGSSYAVAQDKDVTDFHGKDPTKKEIIDALTPGGGEDDLEFRSLMLGGAAMSAEKKAISMQVNFERSSYQLTSDAKDVLNNLGAALQGAELGQYRFLIEGHTDASGAEIYNQHLSERRAESVKQYLVRTAGIDSSRLKTAGRGESDLLDSAKPKSGANRRVQIVNLQ